MARIELVQAQHDLTEVGQRLQDWHAFVKTDSLFIQRTREYEMRQCTDIMDTLIYGVQPEHRIRLTVGRTAIRGSDFWKREYDMADEIPRILEPNSELILERAERINRRNFRRQPPVTELYVGDYAVLVGLSVIGKTLTEGGQLAVVNAPERD